MHAAIVTDHEAQKELIRSTQERTALEFMPELCGLAATASDVTAEPPAIADDPPACFALGFIHVDAVATALFSAGAVCT